MLAQESKVAFRTSQSESDMVIPSVKTQPLFTSDCTIAEMETILANAETKDLRKYSRSRNLRVDVCFDSYNALVRRFKRQPHIQGK